MRKIGASGADALFLGGLIDENGAQVIKDKVAVLGPNDGDVKLLMPDGFTTQQTIDEAGVKNSQGSFLSIAGVPIDDFKGEAADFAAKLKEALGGKPVDPYAIYGAQAVQIVLDAIANGDGSRQSVIDGIFSTKVENGLLGTFEIGPERRSGPGGRGRCRIHHLPSRRQARDGDHALAEARDRGRRSRRISEGRSLSGEGFCPPPIGFRISRSQFRPAANPRRPSRLS